MKIKKNLIIITFALCVLSLLCCFVLQFHIYPVGLLNKYNINVANLKIFLLSLLYGIFGSSFVALIMSVQEYNNTKEFWLSALFDLLCQYRYVFANVKIIDPNILKHKFEDVKEENIPIIYDSYGNSIYSDKEQLLITEISYKKKLDECMEYYISKNNYIKDEHLHQKLNDCYDNLDFFQKKNKKKVQEIYNFIQRTENILNEIVQWNFKPDNVKQTTNIEKDGVEKIQSHLISVKNIKNEDFSGICFFNIYIKEIDRCMDTTRKLRYGNKKIEKYEKDLNDYYFYFTLKET